MNWLKNWIKSLNKQMRPHKGFKLICIAKLEGPTNKISWNTYNAQEQDILVNEKDQPLTIPVEMFKKGTRLEFWEPIK